MFSNRSTKNRLKVLRCQCPLGLIPHFYRLWKLFKHDRSYWVCQCPLGLIPHFYEPAMKIELFIPRIKCQCPLGLIPHFYVLKISTIYHFTLLVSMPSRAYTSFLQEKHGSDLEPISYCVNALSGLYLISTVPLQKPRFYAVSRACFCRYLSEYSDNSRFSCMLTFWTYLMRCTYP